MHAQQTTKGGSFTDSCITLLFQIIANDEPAAKDITVIKSKCLISER